MANKVGTRVALLASGSGTNVQAIIDETNAGDLPIKIVGVFSDVESAYALERARRFDIPAVFVNPKGCGSRVEYDMQLCKEIDKYCPDLIVLAGFMRILSKEFVQPRFGSIMNIHPSLLPKYKGLDTHRRVLKAGDEHHGVTVHFVIPELDAGPIIVQAQIDVEKKETAEHLQQRIHECEYKIYPQAIKWFAERRLSIEGGKVLLDGTRSPSQFLKL